MTNLPATSARRQTLDTGTTVSHLDTIIAGEPVTITVCEWLDGHKLFKTPTTKSRESLSDLILDLERQCADPVVSRVGGGREGGGSSVRS